MTEYEPKDFGKNMWLDQFIACAIDQALAEKSERLKGKLSRPIVKVTGLLLAPLITRNIPNDILEHLNIEFVKPRNSRDDLQDKGITQIIEILSEEFGNEVTARIKLSISDEIVRRLPQK